ncbi:unnamed protein product, partial [Dovyalis caffra]
FGVLGRWLEVEWPCGQHNGCRTMKLDVSDECPAKQMMLDRRLPESDSTRWTCRTVEGINRGG